MQWTHYLAQSTSDAVWSSFVIKLTYEAEWLRKAILKIGQFFVIKFLNFLVSHEIRKCYRSMTHGAYVTYRADGAHGTPGTN